LIAAKEELRQESGYFAESWEAVKSFYPLSAISTEKTVLFHATKLTKGNFEREETETDMKLHVLEWKEVESHISSGFIYEGQTLAALFLFYVWKRAHQ
jgi:hypothetical protein